MYLEVMEDLVVQFQLVDQMALHLDCCLEGQMGQVKAYLMACLMVSDLD